jgi:RNA polymerase sigma-70 factor (ECF subfamily)
MMAAPNGRVSVPAGTPVLPIREATMGILSPDLANVEVETVDRGPFERAFSRHYSRVYRILSGLVGPDEADDAAQEVFLRLFDSPLVHESDERIGAWLHRVAVNQGYNLLRSRRRQTSHLERAGQLAQAETETREQELNPIRAAVAREEATLVQAALARLPERQRAVLVLRQAGLSYAEVAAAAGVKPNSVGALLARAEAHLREHYLHLAGDTPRGPSANRS